MSHRWYAGRGWVCNDLNDRVLQNAIERERRNYELAIESAKLQSLLIGLLLGAAFVVAVQVLFG